MRRRNRDEGNEVVGRSVHSQPGGISAGLVFRSVSGEHVPIGMDGSAMLTDRIESGWIGAFAEVFEMCRMRPEALARTVPTPKLKDQTSLHRSNVFEPCFARFVWFGQFAGSILAHSPKIGFTVYLTENARPVKPKIY